MNLIAFFAFFTTISQFINILGDDIGFEEKTRMSYMLCAGCFAPLNKGQSIDAKTSPLTALNNAFASVKARVASGPAIAA